LKAKSLFLPNTWI